MLNMESILRDVIHEKTRLQSRVVELMLQKDQPRNYEALVGATNAVLVHQNAVTSM